MNNRSTEFQRRSLLKTGLLGLSTVFLAPRTFVRAAFGAGAPGARKLVLVDLGGGNDGFNTCVPFGLADGAYYEEYRERLAVEESSLLKIDDEIGFHPSFAAIKRMYDAGLVGVAQGVSYPSPSFSHEVSHGIWASGDPSGISTQGWLARYLARRPEGDFPCAADMLGEVGAILRGSGRFVPGIDAIEDFRFPVDERHFDDGAVKRSAFDRITAGLTSETGLVGQIANTTNGLLSLIDTFATVPEISHVESYPDHYFAESLRETVRLMSSGLGLDFFHVGIDGFDTHAQQEDKGYHSSLLSTVSDGLDAFWTDLTNEGHADDTLIVVYSEFGRTVYENGSKGTDHGTVNPVFLIGHDVAPGLRTPHASMHPDDLTEDESEPALTTDFRDVFGGVVANWLNDDPEAVFPGHAYEDLGLFT